MEPIKHCEAEAHGFTPYLLRSSQQFVHPVDGVAQIASSADDLAATCRAVAKVLPGRCRLHAPDRRPPARLVAAAARRPAAHRLHRRRVTAPRPAGGLRPTLLDPARSPARGAGRCGRLTGVDDRRARRAPGAAGPGGGHRQRAAPRAHHDRAHPRDDASRPARGPGAAAGARPRRRPQRVVVGVDAADAARACRASTVEPQHVVLNAAGVEVARVDLRIRGTRRVPEYDGSDTATGCVTRRTCAATRRWPAKASNGTATSPPRSSPPPSGSSATPRTPWACRTCQDASGRGASRRVGRRSRRPGSSPSGAGCNGSSARTSPRPKRGSGANPSPTGAHLHDSPSQNL